MSRLDENRGQRRTARVLEDDSVSMAAWPMWRAGPVWAWFRHWWICDLDMVIGVTHHGILWMR